MAKSFLANLTSRFAPTDEQIMWRAQQEADGAAYSELVARWEEPIRRLCERMTGDSHRAKDLAQEVFSRVFAKREDFAPSAKFSTFLWRVALNECYDELRRRQRRAEFSLADVEEPELARLPADEETPSARLEQRERADTVRAALQRLAEHYRAVVVLRHYEGLKFREIAEVLEVPEGTVKSRMVEALDQLAVLLKELNPGAPEVPEPPKQVLCV